MKERTISGRKGIHDINVSSKVEYNNLSEYVSYSSEDLQASDLNTSSESETLSPKLNQRKSLPKKTGYDPKLASLSPRRYEYSNLSASKSYIYGAIVIAVVALFLIYLLRRDVPSLSSKLCDFSELEKKYPQEEKDLWKHLNIRIGNLLVNPAVYLFLHLNTSIHRANDVIGDIANISSFCLDSSLKPVNIESYVFTSEKSIDDYGHIVRQYEETVKEGNAVLVPILNKIPPKTARALHSICDTHSFIRSKVVIFLSLAVEEHKEDRVIDTARNILGQLWRAELTDYELEPLITRVTQDVFFLKSN